MKSYIVGITFCLCVILFASCSNPHSLDEGTEDTRYTEDTTRAKNDKKKEKEIKKTDEWKTPDVQSSEEYAEKGYVVNVHGKMTNLDRLEKFLENANNHQPDKMTTIVFTIEGDPIFRRVIYNGKQFAYVYDNSLDAYAGSGKGIKKGTCSDFTNEKTDRGTSYQLTGCTGEPETLEVLFVPQSDDKNQSTS